MGASGSVAEIQRRLREFAATLGPEEWVTGRGWGPSDFPGNQAHRKYLDEVLRLIRAEYYGRVTLSLEAGQIVFLKKEQTIKLKN